MLKSEVLPVRAQLEGSFIAFCCYFYPLLVGRPFIIDSPLGREPHVITVAKALTKVARNETVRLILNLPPGHGKSTILVLWVAWTLARFPDSHYLYISYSPTIAATQTGLIRQLIALPDYRVLFGITLNPASKAKDNFETQAGGKVAAFGARGSITGLNAGFSTTEQRFTGALIIDDAHKPDEVHSETFRNKVKDNYHQTLVRRLRSPYVPTIFLGQRLHEDDLPAHLLAGEDGHVWTKVILPALDPCGNVLCPRIISKEDLLLLQDHNHYVFTTQYQQIGVSAGGNLFKKEDFVLLDTEPEMLLTFITIDGAETAHTHNDATVFSLFGVYRMSEKGQYGLHWIDCHETWVEPKDLENEFYTFWRDCNRYPTPPTLAAIEKKSSGTFLLSLLNDLRGIKIRPIERYAHHNKIQRFRDIQPYISMKYLSLPQQAAHTESTIDHMTKITGNNTHRRDDRADTCADAMRMAFLDKSLQFEETKTGNSDFLSRLKAENELRKNTLNRYRYRTPHSTRR